MRTNIRHLESGDFEIISPVINEWWGGRDVGGLLPRLFFEHFRPTSFALTEDQNLVAFVAGFHSQSLPAVAYVHFIGVHPDARGKNYGRSLYQRFIAVASGIGCTEVRAITSPTNVSSIKFHLHMGFVMLPGDGDVEGFPVHLNHGGLGQHRVLFSKQVAGQDSYGSI